MKYFSMIYIFILYILLLVLIYRSDIIEGKSSIVVSLIERIIVVEGGIKQYDCPLGHFEGYNSNK